MVRLLKSELGKHIGEHVVVVAALSEPTWTKQLEIITSQLTRELQFGLVDIAVGVAAYTTVLLLLGGIHWLIITSFDFSKGQHVLFKGYMVVWGFAGDLQQALFHIVGLFVQGTTRISNRELGSIAGKYCYKATNHRYSAHARLLASTWRQGG